MFCPECGIDLIAPNQKFCHNCGTEVIAASKISESKSERFQNEPSPQICYVPVKPQTTLQKGPPGKYSYICFWFAFVSFVIGVGTYFFRYFFNVYYNIRGSIVLNSIILLLRVVGLILGIYSKISSFKALKLEPHNDLEKSGSVSSVIAIVINAIGIVISTIVLISLHLPLSEYYY